MIEAVLLTGGASRRMGVDKSSMLVDGEPQAARIARLMIEAGYPVTVLGRSPIPGCAFLADQSKFAGPLIALSRFTPSREYVFVASCDLPHFEASLISDLESQISDCDAAIPLMEGRLQPLCALYTASAVRLAAEVAVEGDKRIMAWIRRLTVAEAVLSDPRLALNVNSPQDESPFCHPEERGI